MCLDGKNYQLTEHSRMKFYKSFITITLSSLLLFSCVDESPFADESMNGDGKIKLNLSSNNDVESTMPTVRSVSSDIVVPPTEEFQIRMTSSDGSYNKLWASLSEFEKEEGFDAGNYTIEAFYGTPESQGVVKAEEKGHEHSYFYGKSESISIENGKETSVSVTAKLANAVVIVEYSDAFKHYFTDWTTDLITTGSSTLNLGNEEGMCYVVPGDIEVVITAAQQNGKALKLNPATFEAEAQHLYKIKYDIYNGEIGQVDKLVLTFNDDMDDTHNITIDLTEELFNGTAPVITSDGFDLGATMELSDSDNKNLKFVVSASGGIESAILSIKSTGVFNQDYSMDGSLDLCALDEKQKAEFEEKSHIKILGFTGNTERMAQVDLTEFYKNLAKGEHTVSLLVKDKYMRSSGEATLTISRPIDIQVKAGEDPIMFGEDEGDVIILYNGQSPLEQEEKIFTLKYANDLGQWEEAEILSITEVADTKAVDTRTYKYRVKVPNEANRDDFHIRVYYKENTNEVGEVELKRVYFHDIEYDAMATKLRFRFKDENQSDTYNEDITVYLNGEKVDDSRVSYDPDSKIFTVKGLESTETEGKEYTVQTSVAVVENGKTHKYYSKKLSVTTEAQEKLENGDFSEIGQTINIPEINIGGKYIISVSFISDDYQNYSSININEAKDWSSINQYTCYNDSPYPNTWYLVPSTFVIDTVCTIRTVGFNPNGKPITESENGSTRNYYCTNVPAREDLIVKTGELFLGSYNYNGMEEKKKYGISFSSRPSSFSFNYSYMGYNNETGYLSITLRDEEGKEILNKEIDLKATVTGWDFKESMMTEPTTHLDIGLSEYVFNKKAKVLEVIFKSSGIDSPDIYIPTNSDLVEESVTWKNFTQKEGRTIPANQYHSYAKGSVLKISNLKFGYE